MWCSTGLSTGLYLFIRLCKQLVQLVKEWKQTKRMSQLGHSMTFHDFHLLLLDQMFIACSWVLVKSSNDMDLRGVKRRPPVAKEAHFTPHLHFKCQRHRQHVNPVASHFTSSHVSLQITAALIWRQSATATQVHQRFRQCANYFISNLSVTFELV